MQASSKKLLVVATTCVFLIIAVATVFAQNSARAAPASNDYVKGRWFDRIFIMMFENQPLLNTMLHPYFRELITRGTFMRSFRAVTHPSQPVCV